MFRYLDLSLTGIKIKFRTCKILNSCLGIFLLNIASIIKYKGIAIFLYSSTIKLDRAGCINSIEDLILHRKMTVLQHCFILSC